MTYTTASGVPIPQGTDAFNPPAQFKDWGDKASLFDYSLSVPTNSERTALAAPELRPGLLVFVQSTKILWIYDGSAWNIVWYDTGWTNLPLVAAVTGSARYRVVGRVVEARFDISGTLTSNMQLTEPMPAGIAPSGVPDTLALATYVNSPSSGATAFVSSTSNDLRFVGTGTRARGGGTWLIG